MGPTNIASLGCAGARLPATMRQPDCVRTRRGGCDCGAVRYELELDPCGGDLRATAGELTVRTSAFKLLSGEESLSGHELFSPHVHHFYCELCGVCSFSRHNVEQQSVAFYAVDLCCLDVPRSVWESAL